MELYAKQADWCDTSSREETYVQKTVDVCYMVQHVQGSLWHEESASGMEERQVGKFIAVKVLKYKM